MIRNWAQFSFRPVLALRLALAPLLFAHLVASDVQAAAPGQLDYASADAAVSALVTAVRAGDPKAMISVLGTAGQRLVTSGDPVQDKNGRDRFVAAYDTKHSLAARGPNRMELVVGANDWPLPIPIVQEGGRWYFDAVAAADELIDRRIGKNELLTIRTLLALVPAQRDYFERLKTGSGIGAYAQRIMSTTGQSDGLYWAATAGEAPSPLSPLVDQALDEGYPGAADPSGKPIPYHGYLFRILKAQGPNAPGGAKNFLSNGQLIGGFSFLAWPADYGNSGIVSFIVGPDGVVFQKDLGPNTARLAAGVTRFDPDLSWARIDLTD
jgi:hypothetical protein